MGFEVTATRKRPQTFETLVGQEFVVSTLKNSIEQGRIAHAYLFSGPRGVGKTSSARLLAKALNCVHGPTAQPCGVCENCKAITAASSMDVIEIDGASNTGVNDVRAIKEEVLFPPASSKYKIYIIDEVHMLSQSAFNALLKTIEEPPEYVVFIFSSTETQKVPATVRSRCQQYNFNLLSVETIKEMLKKAAEELNVTAEEDALYWIAGEASGSMRDAYTLFDQVVAFSGGNITMQGIREKLGLAGQDVMKEILAAVIAQDKEKAMQKLRSLISGGVSTENIIKEFCEMFRVLLLLKEGIKSQDILGGKLNVYPTEMVDYYSEEQLEAALEMFLNLYRNIRYSLNVYSELELAVSRLFRLKYTYSNTGVIEQLARLKNDLLSGKLSPLNPGLEKEETVVPSAANITTENITTESIAKESTATESIGIENTEPEVKVEEKAENTKAENSKPAVKKQDITADFLYAFDGKIIK